MRNRDYKKIVDLLIEVLPYALKDKRFALKGGTAINLFHRDFPRLSVDIDLCYLPLEQRKTTFKNIHSILEDIKKDLEERLHLNVVSNFPLDGEGKEAKLIAKNDIVEIKIEPNYTIRSSLFDAESKELCLKAQKEFNKTVEVQCLNLADTYGGKICAALDRQHPRDLFDVKNLFENEGITEDVKDSFILYLISHNRPINELLKPNFKNIENAYRSEFVSMAEVDTPLEDLLETRERLVKDINSCLTRSDKEFLISFVSNKPDWSKVRDRKIRDYPSVKWKMFNQEKMNHKKQEEYVRLVSEVLND